MLWLKALHIIAVISWFAGLFYLPRLFVYHADTTDRVSNERFKIMERRLYRGIMMPAAIATIVFGLWMIMLNPEYYLAQTWLILKLVLVMLVLVYHFFCGYYLRLFSQDRNTKSHIFFRYFNEIPTLLLILIVILAVVRPF